MTNIPMFNIYSLSRNHTVEKREVREENTYLQFLIEAWNDTVNLYVEEAIHERMISYIRKDSDADYGNILSAFEADVNAKYVVFEHTFCGEKVMNIVIKSSLYKQAIPIEGFNLIDGIIVPNKNSTIESISDPQHSIPSHALLNIINTNNPNDDTVIITNIENDSSGFFTLSSISAFLLFSPNRFKLNKKYLSVILAEYIPIEIIEQNYEIFLSAVYNDIKTSSHVNKTTSNITDDTLNALKAIYSSHGVVHDDNKYHGTYGMQKIKTFRSVAELFKIANNDMYITWHKQYLIDIINDVVGEVIASGKKLNKQDIAKLYVPLVKAYLFLDFVYIGNDLYQKSESSYLRASSVSDLLKRLRTIQEFISSSDILSAEVYQTFVNNINHIKYSENDTYLKSFFSHEYENAEKLLNETRGIMAWEDCVSEVIETEENRKHTLSLNLRPGRIEDFITFCSGTALGYDDGSYKIDEEKERLHHAAIKNWLGKMFVDKATRRSVKRMIGALLMGDNLGKKVFFLDGIGNNSKSALLDLLNKTLGDYFVTTSVSLLTTNAQKKDSANASPDVLKLKGRRLAVIQEPSQQIMFDPGSLKMRSSRDDDKARPLYGKSDISFKAMYTIWIACNNPPKIEGADYQSLKRCTIVPVRSRFLETDYPPTEEEQYRDRVFPADPNFNTYIGRWKATFARCMVRWCKKYIAESTIFKFSEEITAATDFYYHSNSEMMSFYRRHLIKTDNSDDFINYSTLLESYNIYTVKTIGTSSNGGIGKFLSLIKTFVFGKYVDREKNMDCNIWDDNARVLRGYKLAN